MASDPGSRPDIGPVRAGTTTIPRRLFRIWLSDGDPADEMPVEFRRYGGEFDLLHPGWVRTDVRWTEALPRLRNQTLFDTAPEWCPRDWKRARSDLLRLELLWMFGGVYVDCDVQPLRPFDGLLGVAGGAFVGWSPNRGPNGRRLLTQAVLGATKHHPFIGACIEQAEAAVQRYRGRPLAQVVGPWHITRVWESMGDAAGVTVLDESVFYPQSNAERAKAKGREPELSGSLAWHRWANSRDNRKGGIRA